MHIIATVLSAMVRILFWEGGGGEFKLPAESLTGALPRLQLHINLLHDARPPSCLLPHLTLSMHVLGFAVESM